MGGKICPPVLGSVLHAKGGRYNNDRRNNRAQKIGWRPKRAAQQVDAAAPPVRTEDPGEYQRVVKRCWVKADFAGNVVYPLTVKDLRDPRCGSADVFEKTRVDSGEDNIGSETANRKGSSPSPVQLKNLTFPKSTSSCALAAHQPDFSIQTAERPQLTASSSPQDLNTTEMARMLVNIHTLVQKDHDKKSWLYDVPIVTLRSKYMTTEAPEAKKEGVERESFPKALKGDAVELHDFADWFLREHRGAANAEKLIRGAGRAMGAMEIGLTPRGEQFGHKTIQALVGKYIHTQYEALIASPIFQPPSSLGHVTRYTDC